MKRLAARFPIADLGRQDSRQGDVLENTETNLIGHDGQDPAEIRAGARRDIAA